MYSQTEVPFPLGLGPRGRGGGRWEMAGGGVGDRRDVVANYPALCTWNYQELLLQPLLPRNQHPSPTTSFTNIKQNPMYFY